MNREIKLNSYINILVVILLSIIWVLCKSDTNVKQKTPTDKLIKYRKDRRVEKINRIDSIYIGADLIHYSYHLIDSNKKIFKSF